MRMSWISRKWLVSNDHSTLCVSTRSHTQTVGYRWSIVCWFVLLFSENNRHTLAYFFLHEWSLTTTSNRILCQKNSVFRSQIWQINGTFFRVCVSAVSHWQEANETKSRTHIRIVHVITRDSIGNNRIVRIEVKTKNDANACGSAGHGVWRHPSVPLLLFNENQQKSMPPNRINAMINFLGDWICVPSA